MKMQLKLSGSGNHHLELALSIMQHLRQSRTRKTNPQVEPEHTSTVHNRPKASNTLQNHQEPYKTSHNHANIATTILKRQDLSTTGQNHLAASKS